MPQAAPGTVVQPGAALIPTGEPYITPGTLPPGGTTGRPLVKATDADGDVAWGDVIVVASDVGINGGYRFANGCAYEQAAGDLLQIRMPQGGLRPRIVTTSGAVVGDLAVTPDLGAYLSRGGGEMNQGSFISWAGGGGYIGSGHGSYLDITGFGTIRCWTSQSSGGTQTAADISQGSLAAWGFVTKSTRDSKDNIRDLDVGQVDRDIMSLRAVSYERYGRVQMGFVAEDSPASVVVPAQSEGSTIGVDLTSLLALAIAKIQDLEARLASLEGK
jgi:hypothetical protein